MFPRADSLFLLAGYLACSASLGCSGNRRDSAAPPCPTEATESAAVLALPTGTIHGTLRIPAGCGPSPVALLIAGSGPTDRDGNAIPAVKTNSHAALARALSDDGVASLRYDKRGVGQSRGAAPSEADLRLEHYSDDAASWLRQLKRDGRFGATIVIGHSEGSLLGLIAMEQEPAQAFVSLAGPGRPAGQVLRAQLARQISGPLLETATQILDQLEAGREVADVPAPLMNVFRPSVQPYLISWLKYDPARELAKLTMPALVAQGTTDLQVDIVDAQVLAAARPDTRLLLVDGMCHVLKMATDEATDQQAAYTDPARPIAAALVEGINGFLDAVLSP